MNQGVPVPQDCISQSCDQPKGHLFQVCTKSSTGQWRPKKSGRYLQDIATYQGAGRYQDDNVGCRPRPVMLHGEGLVEDSPGSYLCDRQLEQCPGLNVTERLLCSLLSHPPSPYSYFLPSPQPQPSDYSSPCLHSGLPLGVLKGQGPEYTHFRLCAQGLLRDHPQLHFLCSGCEVPLSLFKRKRRNDLCSPSDTNTSWSV